MLDLCEETPLSLSQVAKRLPPNRGGKPVHVSTVMRWITKGVRGVRLEAVRLGGRWVSTAEALQRFSDCLTAARYDSDPAVTATTASTLKAAERADRELATLGF